MQARRLQHFTAFLIAVIGLIALTIQADIYLSFAQSRGLPLWKGLERFFSYFTVLSNLIATLTMLSLALPEHWPGLQRLRRFFRAPATHAASVVYLSVVALIFALLLANLRVRTGWEAVADFCLHRLVPLLYLLHWLAFAPKGQLRATHANWWLLWPAIYLVVILWRGAAEGRYPYPFLNVEQLGYARTLINCAGVTGVFLVLSLTLWACDRWLGRRPLVARE